MLIYPHAVIVRKTANESINISAMNLISSNDRADNPMTQLKDEYCLKNEKIQNICRWHLLLHTDDI